MTFSLTTVLKSFRRRLINLSSRNRSLLLTTLPGRQFLDLHETDFLLNKPSFSTIADLVGRKASVSVCEVLDARRERSNEISRKLRQISRTARFIEEERGTEDLYVGWPFVRGKFLDGTVVHGPLLFFPVQIFQEGKLWKLQHRGDELAFLNPTLALAYGQFNQVKVADEAVEKTMTDFDRDSLVFRTQLYEWLKTTPFEINFNQDLFTDKLQFFNRLTAKELDQLERIGELKLYPEAVLGIFPQASSFLVPDYDELITRADREEGDDNGEGINRLFALENLARSTFLPEKNIHTPLPMDASQEAAIRAVKSGQSLVVQGPPGTGKSQLIANLMADAAASGKRVLLVCQKRAALDVVQERLRCVGMAPFLALIHDFQDDRRALYTQIAGQIEQIETYRQQNNGLNTVLLERDFETESRRIDETINQLQAFKDALFDTSICGVSAKELYLINAPLSEVKSLIDVNDIYQQFPLTDVDKFLERMTEFESYRQRISKHHPWIERVTFASFTNADLTKASHGLLDWVQLRDAANQETKSLLGRSLSFDELTDWQAYSQELSSVLSLLNGPDAAVLWNVVNHLRDKPNHAVRTINEALLGEIIRRWEEALAEPGPELSLQVSDLTAFKRVLADALAARSSWLIWNWWQLTNAGKEQLKRVITQNSLSLSELDLQKLAIKVDKRIQLEAIYSEIKPLFAELSVDATPTYMRLLLRAKHTVERLNPLRPVQQLPAHAWLTSAQFMKAVAELLRITAAVEQQRLFLQTYFVSNQLRQSWNDNVYVNQLRDSLHTDFDLLVEADRLQATFVEAEQTVVERLNRQQVANWVDTFRYSLYRAWLNHIERLHPDLTSVSSLKMSQLEQTLQDSIKQKQILSRDILLVRLREQTYGNLTFNRLNKLVTYRDLLHQTTKKRNIWPVRKLMESFTDEVFKVVPCWLASPESVSALFPLRNDLFDLVIFDEASQCFAETGIPAMVRGKQVMITGDNQQLRPSDLYQIRIDNTDLEEVPAVLEVESLLELAAQQLPQVRLTEHYRSRSLDLIAFSNHHFYGDKLSLLPQFDTANRHEPSIRYINVEGTWQQNTNPIEAAAVLQLLEQITTELPGRSVGVVTFNYPQQQFIQDRFDELRADNSEFALPPDLFIKNIENVQGDERDIIVFSIGYASDQRGQLSMQFGSLNADGGGNRLNVAITRARERIYVVTSLWPEQLTITETANQGPKLLKAYLSYALEVAQQQFQPKPYSQKVLPPENLLKDKLAAQHPNWRFELPFADLTVKQGDYYQSLVLTDDDLYYQQTPKQAHAYLPIALQSHNWCFERVWSREFWRTKMD